MSTIQMLFVVMLTFLATTLVCSTGPTHAENNACIKALVEGNSAFAFDLYGKLANRKGNLFFSPYSISTALGMTYAGARGPTAEQMSQALHFALEPEQLHRTFGQLEAQLNAFQEKGNIELSVANALWVQEDYRFLDEFFDLVTKRYRARLSYANFRAAVEAARQEINGWVERQTKDKIRELLKPGVLNALTRLVLVNAIYFKGLWESPFMKEATKEAPFWVTPELSVDVPMMSQEEAFKYADTEEMQIVQLPYAGDDLSMIILLPREIDGLPQLETILSLENLDEWLLSLHKRNVIVHLPRFKITSQFSLAQTLASMGMSDAFDANNADFSGMDGTRSLFISAVVHKAFVDVNEEGTEAAAATGVVVGVTSVPAPPPIFKADHPFIFFIRDNDSGSVLFFGRVADPTE